MGITSGLVAPGTQNWEPTTSRKTVAPAARLCVCVAFSRRQCERRWQRQIDQPDHLIDHGQDVRVGVDCSSGSKDHSRRWDGGPSNPSPDATPWDHAQMAGEGDDGPQADAGVLPVWSSRVVLASRSAERWEQARCPSVCADRAAGDRPLDVNVVGTWLACREAARPMRSAGYGRILTLASALGWSGRGPVWLCREQGRRRSAQPQPRHRTGQGPGSPSTRSHRARSALLSLTDPHASQLTGAILSADGGWTAR
jgi:hypothetical protein